MFVNTRNTSRNDATRQFYRSVASRPRVGSRFGGQPQTTYHARDATATIDRVSRRHDGVAPMTGAGGTSGGIGTFFGGLAMVIAGGYLLLTRVNVMSGGWLFYGYSAFGLSLFPLLIGIGVLFYNGRS